ncbi:ATP-binding protein [archaeon]|jgi:hypothetical protein|nr:ATP-binding protein [archaeon]
MGKINFTQEDVGEWASKPHSIKLRFYHNFPGVLLKAVRYARENFFNELVDLYSGVNSRLDDALLENNSTKIYEEFCNLPNLDSFDYPDELIRFNHERLFNYLNWEFSKSSGLFSLAHDCEDFENKGLIIQDNAFVNYEFGLDELWLKKDYALNVVLPIVQNSVDHGMQNSGEIYVVKIFGEEMNGNFYRISIQDKGKGISKNNLERIFDSGFTTRENKKGHGLGLSLAKSFVEGNGGVMDVESELGVGAKFSFTIPGLKKVGDSYIQE